MTTQQLSPQRDDTRGETAALLAAAAKQRRKRGADRAAAAQAAEAVAIEEPQMPDLLAQEAEVEAAPKPKRRRAEPVAAPTPSTPEAPEAEAPDTAPAKPRKRRKQRDTPPLEEAAHPKQGLVTRAVLGGIGGVAMAATGARRLGLWGVTAVAAAMLIAGAAAYAWRALPEASPVGGLRVAWLSGPQLAPDDVLGLVNAFPGRARLKHPDREVLDEFAAWLRGHDMVREVQRISVVHERLEDGQLRRAVEIRLGLREPRLPVVLANRVRAWVDAEGRVLPGMVPGPEGPLPVLRGIEAGGLPAVQEALAAWSRLETALDPDLVVGIDCSDDLGLAGQRGVVLHTRSGTRLVWGRPEDAEYGIDRDRKARELVHTIRCQGDLARVATINVRFKQPVYTLK